MFNWRAVLKHYREGGSGRVLEVLCARGLIPDRLLYYHEINILYLQSLNPKAAKPRGNGYEFTTAREQDAHELAAISVGAEKRMALTRFFERFFENGNRCLVARNNGKIVGYNWACHSRYTISNDHYRHRQLHLLLRPNEVVLSNGYVHPEYRMKGLYPELIRSAVESYPKDTLFYTTIAGLNDVSLKQDRRLGFEFLMRLGCHRIGISPYFWTVGQPGKPRRWIGWNQPTVALEELIAGSGKNGTAFHEWAVNRDPARSIIGAFGNRGS